MLKSANVCSVGLRRQVNQDRLGAFQQKECGLYFVADGMGGHYRGEMASGMLYTSLSEWWELFASDPVKEEFSSCVEELRELLTRCNEGIRAATPPGEICGSTLVLLWLQNGKYAQIHAGDSRCYQVSNQGGWMAHMIQTTHDDVCTERTQNYGRLTQSVGSSRECMFSVQTGSVQGRTLFALCSDGVYKYCPEQRLEGALMAAFRSGDLEAGAAQVAKCVEKGGAGDNFSLVLTLSAEE